MKETEFYSLRVKNEYRDRDGKLPYCKHCIKDIAYETSQMNRVNVKALQRMLRMLDLPFIIDVYRSAQDSKGATIGKYFNILALHQYTLYWEESVFTDDAEKNEEYKKDLMDEIEVRREISDRKDDMEIIPSVYRSLEYLKHKYSEKFDLQMLRDFERAYIKLAETVIINDKIDEENLIYAAINQVKYKASLASNKEVGNNTKRAQDAYLKSLGRLETIDKSSESPTLSMLFKKLEETKGDLSFLKFKFDKKAMDKADIAIYFIIKHNMETLGYSTEDLKYEDIYKHFQEIQDEIETEEMNIDLTPEDFEL
jgi:hypothetical protein